MQAGYDRGLNPRLAIDLAAVLDPVDVDLSGLIVHRVEDPPVPDPEAIALRVLMQLPHAGRSGFIPQPLEPLHDPAGYRRVELPDLAVGRGFDDQLIFRLCPQLRAP